MKVLFLDVDGVLNSTDWESRCPSKEEMLILWPKLLPLERHALRYLDPDAVARLEQIVEKTEALVAVSSSWRLDWPLPKLNELLRIRGFKHMLFSATPATHEVWTQSIYSFPGRGAEISGWLSLINHEAQYVIVDDCQIHGHPPFNVYQTDPRKGLTDVDAAEIIKRLS